MDLGEVVSRIQANNSGLGKIEGELSEEDKAALLLEEFSSLPKEKYDRIVELEALNAQLAIQGLSLAILVLEGSKKLDGTYWGAGSDFAYAKIRGVRRFQSQFYGKSEKKDIKSRFGIDAVSFDAHKDSHPFRKGSQNFALQKTFGNCRHPEYEMIWNEIIYTVRAGGLIVTTDTIPDSVSGKIQRVADTLSGFNGLGFKWLTGETSTYRPGKFEFYRRV